MVVGAICGEFAARVDGGRQKGHNGFQNEVRLRADRGFNSVVSWGGRLHGDLVHAAFSGWGAAPGADLLRRLVPEHRVSRADVAEDFCAPRAMRELSRCAARAARRFDVKRTSLVPGRPEEGATVYLGAPTSAVRCRIYEKGKKAIIDGDVIEAENLPADLNGQPIENWVRMELQVRPQSHAKAYVAKMTPESLWGCAEWSAELYRDVAAKEVPRVRVGSVYRADDEARTWGALARMFGRFLERQAGELGDWQCVGLQLRDEVAKARKARGHGGG